MSPTTPSTPTPADSPSGDVVARPPHPMARMVMVAVVLILGGSLAWFFTKPAPPAGTTQDKSPVEFAKGSEADQLQARLEQQLSELAGSMFSSPFAVLTPENRAQVEQLAKPYPKATFEEKSSSYEESPQQGQLYRLIYNSPDSVKEVLAWYQKEWAAEYLTVREHTDGLDGYTLQVRVPGLHVERDIMIIAVPDPVTEQPTTQIWVTIRNTLVPGQDPT